jgi:hypothetical protein
LGLSYVAGIQSHTTVWAPAFPRKGSIRSGWLDNIAASLAVPRTGALIAQTMLTVLTEKSLFSTAKPSEAHLRHDGADGIRRPPAASARTWCPRQNAKHGLERLQVAGHPGVENHLAHRPIPPPRTHGRTSRCRPPGGVHARSTTASRQSCEIAFTLTILSSRPHVVRVLPS